MTLFTLRLRALLLLVLLAGPAWAQQPAWRWANQAVSNAVGQAAYVTAVATDASGNTVVGGAFRGTLTLGSFTLSSASNQPDIFVGRLNAAGQWTQAVRAGGPDIDAVAGLVVDAAGTVTVVGTFTNYGASPTTSATFGNNTIAGNGYIASYVARLNAAGTWTQALPLSGSWVEVRGVALDATGGAVLAGDFAQELTLGTTALMDAGGARDIFVARLNTAGQWTQAVQGSTPSPNGSNYCWVGGMAVDAANGVVLTGYFNGTMSFRYQNLPYMVSAGSNDVFVVRLSAAGTWTQAARAGSAPDERGVALALDAAGNAVVTGTMGNVSTAPGGTSSFGSTTLTGLGRADVFVARLNPAGQWTQAVQAGGVGYEAPSGIAVDGAGNATVVGFFGLDANPTPPPAGYPISFGSTTLAGAGQEDLFVARLGRNGQWQQALAAGGPLNDYGIAVALAPNGDVTVGGGYTGSASFTPFFLSNNTSTAVTSAFVARLGGLPAAARAATPAEVFTMAPNPATAHVRLSWPEAAATVRPVLVLDNLGREVRRQELPARATSASLDVAGLAPGCYLVRCGAAVGRLAVQ